MLKNYAYFKGARLFKGLRVLHLINFPGGTSIPESRDGKWLIFILWFPSKKIALRFEQIVSLVLKKLSYWLYISFEAATLPTSEADIEVDPWMRGDSFLISNSTKHWKCN